MTDDQGTALELSTPSDVTDSSGEYKLIRLKLAELLEAYTGDKGKALELLERWEEGVWAAALLAAPDAASAKEAFSVAGKAFLKKGAS